MTLPSFAANLDGLMDLATKSGVDVRPTLLRALTDLYVQKPVHTPDEEQQYTELALRLLDGVDVATRIAVAERLAAYPRAPLAIAQRLARDVLSVAFPILRFSDVLDAGELESVGWQCGPGHAAVIADRRATPEPAAAEPAPVPEPAAEDLALTPAPPLVPESTAAELSDLFFNAEPEERRLILLNIDYAAPAQPLRSSATLAAATLARLEQAVMAGQIDSVADQLMRLLDLPAAMARRVARDRSGEAMLVAGRALGMPGAMFQRIIMFLDPSIGHSVPRVFALADLFDEVPRRAAEEMVAIWRGRPAHRPARPRPLMREERPRAAFQPELRLQPIKSSMK